MVFIKRQISQKLREMAKKFPIVAVVGPRQSGKTTLVKNIFPKFRLVSLEDLDNRAFADKDPRGFLDTYDEKSIIDEAQKSPTLFSYLQTRVDSVGNTGQFILTGSQNFLLLQKISQSLAGRVGILKLLPLSVEEINNAGISFKQYEEYVFRGFYPAVYDRKINPNDWYASYIQTYLERDVRSISGVENLAVFHKFLQLCAGRVGQIINFSSLANDCGVSHNTIQAWLSILEASFVVFFVQPYFRNFNKRLVKSPKIYFYDTGLVCHLLGITASDQVATHYAKGALFENFIGAEIVKSFFNSGGNTPLYFWRDKTGREIDFLYEKPAGKVQAIEVKAGKTFSSDMADSLIYWQKLAGQGVETTVIYSGDQDQKMNRVEVVSWRNFLYAQSS